VGIRPYRRRSWTRWFRRACRTYSAYSAVVWGSSTDQYAWCAPLHIPVYTDRVDLVPHRHSPRVFAFFLTLAFATKPRLELPFKLKIIKIAGGVLLFERLNVGVSVDIRDSVAVPLL